MNDKKIAQLLVKALKYNPPFVIVHPDINFLVKEVRRLTGEQMIIKSEPDLYIIEQVDQYGRTWENERKRFNPRKYSITAL